MEREGPSSGTSDYLDTFINDFHYQLGSRTTVIEIQKGNGDSFAFPAQSDRVYVEQAWRSPAHIDLATPPLKPFASIIRQ